MKCALLAAWLAACGGGETFVVVTVTARPTVHDVTSLAVTQTSSGTTRTDTLELGSHALPATFSIRATNRLGELDLSITGKAIDGGSVAVGTTTTSFDLETATVQLDPADFVVNTEYAMDEFTTTDFETAGYQLSATANDTWTVAFRNTCTDTCNVFARTIGSDGAPAKTNAAAGTNAYQVTSATTQEGAFPAIAGQGMATIAVWDFNDTVGTGVGVACRGIDAMGTLTPGQRTISTDAADTVVIAPLPTGNFAVSWQVYSPNAAIHTMIAKPDCTTLTSLPVAVAPTAGTRNGPHRSTVAASGTALLYGWIQDDAAYVRGTSTSTSPSFSSAAFKLADPPTGETAEAVRIAPMGAGFAVAIRYVSSTFGAPGQIYLQRTTSTGVVIGTPTLISDKTGSDFTNGRRGFGIATRADGMTMLVWSQCDDGSGGQCDGRLDIYGRLVDATATVVGDPFVVTSTTLADQQDPSVVALSDAFAVAWTDGSKTAPDNDGTAVRARVIYP
ncbi:hypothetical protein BH11MYX1_BH11MYX1_28890 [soil metagenome]